MKQIERLIFLCILVIAVSVSGLVMNHDAQDTRLEYNNVIRNIQRIGEGTGFPVHSLNGYREAYARGFRILLCDLVFSADDVPICNHDLYLNECYPVYCADGTPLETEEPVYLRDCTFETLSGYRYEDVNNPLLSFEEMLAFSKQLGVELYVEIKDMTQPQAKIACDLVKEYGMEDKTSWCGTYEQLQWVTQQIDTARVAMMPMVITDEVIQQTNALKTGNNQVFIFGWYETVLTDEIVNKLIENDIAYEMGTINTMAEVVAYFNQGDAYYYCTGIGAMGAMPGRAMVENGLSK